MLEFARAYRGCLTWLGVVSGILFVATLVMVPLLVARMPSDFFLRPGRISRAKTLPGRAALLAWIVVKNILGIVIVTAGVAMLALPGQGVLTIVVGLCMIDFPRKRKAMLWLVSRPAVLRPLNWMRRRADKPPLLVQPS